MHKYTLKVIVFLYLLAVFLYSPAYAYTTDSEITPKELDQWEAAVKSPTDMQGFYYIVAENPELRLNALDCPIKYVLICVDSRKKKMVAYAYYRDDELILVEIVWDDPEYKDGHFQRIYRIVPEAKMLINWFLMPFLQKFKGDSGLEKT